MKTNGVIINVTDCHVDTGDFNCGEHLRVKIEPGKNQTISCELPNGRFVTFAFLPGVRGTAEIECVDIHSTYGPRVKRPDSDMPAYKHHFVGFTPGGQVFDSRDNKIKVCTLGTLLLGDHYE